MTSKLKPCPFCGGEAELRRKYMPPTMNGKRSLISASVVHHCERQPRQSRAYSEFTGHNEGQAIAAWNTRPREDALKEALKELIEHSAPLTINHPSEWRYDIAVEKCYAIIKEIVMSNPKQNKPLFEVEPNELKSANWSASVNKLPTDEGIEYKHYRLALQAYRKNYKPMRSRISDIAKKSFYGRAAKGSYMERFER